MKAYIHKCATTSALNSFDPGILANLSGEKKHTLLKPDFGSSIPAALIRRMSRIIEIGVGTALKAKGNHDVDGIIVGTGIGTIENALLFLKGCMEMENGLKSPGIFVQSTHNTIAGQIGLVLKNNCYNITHTHRGLSFENALMDAMLLSTQESVSVLVGGVDEKVEIFETFNNDVFPNSKCWLGEGATFFVLNQEKNNALAFVSCFEMKFSWKGSIEVCVDQFLKKNELESPDLILYGNSFFNKNAFYADMNGIGVFNYSDICGVYCTNPSFGLQLAVEIVSSPKMAEQIGLMASTILVVNNFMDIDFSLTYLSSTR